MFFKRITLPGMGLPAVWPVPRLSPTHPCPCPGPSPAGQTLQV